VKLAFRGRSVSPHRQVWLLCGVALAMVAILGCGTLVALASPKSRNHQLESQLIPALAQLELASVSNAKTGQTLQTVAFAVDPATRNAAVASLQASDIAGRDAWRAFKARSAKLPGEAELRRTFLADRVRGIAAGSSIFAGSANGDATAQTVATITAAITADLAKLKALYEARAAHVRSGLHQDLSETQRNTAILSIAAALGLIVVFGFAAASARRREINVEVLDRELNTSSTRNAFEARLQRALEMVETEEDSYVVVNRSLVSCAPGLAAELLLADSSRAHFRQATKTPELNGGGCAVLSPGKCPAASHGQTQVWVSSDDIDACPHLQGRPSGACSAVCVPMSVAGNTVGVFHAIAEDGRPPESGTIGSVELLSRKAGERIGMLRAFTKAEVQALTDPLTGLMNRRSMEVEVRALADAARPYVVAYGDLDHFKQLNDVYGHDAGDRALRLFSRVLRDSVRPDDIPARYGGEEFLIVLPECSISDAVDVIHRLRKRLASAQEGATVPPFTVSFGVASGPLGTPFDDTVELADSALLDAKAQGRDRVVVAGADDHDPDAGASGSRSRPRLVA
jgi:diguanylate cyclase (GGDEF)-like protein